MQVKNALGVIVEPLACVGEQDSPALPLEQGRAKYLFDSLHPLAHRRLRHTQHLRRPGETA